MKFPDKHKIYKILTEIEKSKKNGVLLTTKGLPLNASPVEKLKFKICQSVIKFKRVKRYSNKDIAKLIDIDEAVVSRILHCHINKFKIETLLNYYKIILIASKKVSLIKAFEERIEMLVDDLKYGT